MLVNLYIKNFALFEETSIDFSNGLNIISGETGSGKSILIKALSLLTARRISKNDIGKFADYSLVEASFLASHNLVNFLKDHGFDIEDNLVISRRFDQSSSQVKLNNRPITLAFLREVSSQLIDIHGQHDQLIVLNKANYLNILDSFDGTLDKVKKDLRENLARLKNIEGELASLDLDQTQANREIDLLKFQIDEIDDFDFSNYDEERLSQEHKKLSNQTLILKTLGQIKDEFGTEFSRHSLKDTINEVYAKIIDISSYDKELKVFQSQITDIREQINDLSREIDYYYDSFVIDEHRLSELEQIFKQFQNLKRKYGQNIDEIQAFHSEAINRLKRLENLEAIREQLQTKVNEIKAENNKIAKNLTALRNKTSLKLESDMQTQLREMNMAHVNFEIKMTTSPVIDKDGQDDIDFLISTNKGQDMKSLSSVASGGEISRFMLALKALLADKEEVLTLVFDEIDTGISGRTADIVGNKLQEIAKERQVIVITHLPQIASRGEAHHLLEKRVKDNITYSTVLTLNKEEKIHEVARLISSSQVSEQSLLSASQLIKEARNDTKKTN